MSVRSNFAYIQARLQARHSRRPTDAAWSALEASKNLRHYIEMARMTPLEPWTQKIPAAQDIHALERAVRDVWRRYVYEIAEWHGDDWRQAVQWAAVLVDLLAVEHLSSDEQIWDWLRDDPTVAPFSNADPGSRWTTLALSSFSPIAESCRGGGTPQAGWLDRWRSILPDLSATQRRSLDRLVSDIEDYMAALSADDLSISDMLNRRQALDEKLSINLRRYSQEPVAVFSHLALVLLDLGRFRGGLLRRALFADYAEGGT